LADIVPLYRRLRPIQPNLAKATFSVEYRRARKVLANLAAGCE
jgi:hypothetical protein